MENSAEALKLAFSILVFVVAISTTFSVISQAKSTADMYTFFANNVLLIGTPKDVWLKLVRYLRNIEIYIKSCQKNAYLDINDKDILSTEIRYNLRPILRNKRIEGYI